jgi:hypothetical protein
MKRHFNVLGLTEESLTINVMKIGSTVLLDTDLELTFPDAVIYKNSEDFVTCVKKFIESSD